MSAMGYGPCLYEHGHHTAVAGEGIHAAAAMAAGSALRCPRKVAKMPSSDETTQYAARGQGDRKLRDLPRSWRGVPAGGAMRAGRVGERKGGSGMVSPRILRRANATCSGGDWARHWHVQQCKVAPHFGAYVALRSIQGKDDSHSHIRRQSGVIRTPSHPQHQFPDGRTCRSGDDSRRRYSTAMAGSHPPAMRMLTDLVYRGIFHARSHRQIPRIACLRAHTVECRESNVTRYTAQARLFTLRSLMVLGIPRNRDGKRPNAGGRRGVRAMHKNAKKVHERFSTCGVQQHSRAKTPNDVASCREVVKTRNAYLAGCKECIASIRHLNRHGRSWNLGEENDGVLGDQDVTKPLGKLNGRSGTTASAAMEKHATFVRCALNAYRQTNTCTTCLQAFQVAGLHTLSWKPPHVVLRRPLVRHSGGDGPTRRSRAKPPDRAFTSLGSRISRRPAPLVCGSRPGMRWREPTRGELCRGQHCPGNSCGHWPTQTCS
jgi:hypothetical protein